MLEGEGFGAYPTHQQRIRTRIPARRYYRRSKYPSPLHDPPVDFLQEVQYDDDDDDDDEESCANAVKKVAGAMVNVASEFYHKVRECFLQDEGYIQV